MQNLFLFPVVFFLVCSYCFTNPLAEETIVGEQAAPPPPAKAMEAERQLTEEEAIKIGSSLGRIHVTMGQSKLLRTSEEVKRVAITSPDIATVQAVSQWEVLVDGKKPGITTMIIWDAKDKTYIYDVTVQRDVELLKERLKQIDAGIKVEVYAAQDTVILFGEVDAPAKITKAIAIAASFFEDSGMQVLAGPGGTIAAEGYRPKPLKFAPLGRGTAVGERGAISFEEVSRVWNVGEGAIITTKNGKVISFLMLANPLQVELQVRFVQVDLRKLKEYGFDTVLDAFRFEDTKLGFISGTPFEGTTESPSGVLRYFLIHRTDHFLFSTQLRALEDRQVIKTLSEPNLTVISGQEATFLVGGEFPYLVPQRSLGTIAESFFTVEWKVFGNKLELVPEVKEGGMINLKLTPEVSERSEELGVNFPVAGAGNRFVRIPGLTTRRAETTVEMEDRESLVIAGLVSEKERDVVTQTPIIGDIPGLGVFFRRKLRQQDRTELMIVVTPRLVRPMSPKETESVLEPFKRKSVHDKFLEKKFEPSKWLMSPTGYQE